MCIIRLCCAFNPHLLLQYGKQLRFAVFHSLLVIGVDDPDQSVCLFEVVPPERPQALLTSYVPCSNNNNRVRSACDALKDQAEAHRFRLPTYMQRVSLVEEGLDVEA